MGGRRETRLDVITTSPDGDPGWSGRRRARQALGPLGSISCSLLALPLTGTSRRQGGYPKSSRSLGWQSEPINPPEPHTESAAQLRLSACLRAHKEGPQSRT